MQHPMELMTTEQIINAAVEAVRAPRGRKMISAGGRNMQVRTPGERVLFLPNGAKVKVTTDDSGKATQIEENDSLHGIARPDTYRIKMARS